MRDNGGMSDNSKEEKASQQTAKRKKFSNDRYWGFAAYVRTESGKWRLAINWKRIALVGATLGALGYVGIAAARYFNDKYGKGLEETSFVDMLEYPLSRATRIEHRKRLGDMYIERAKEAKTPGEMIANVRTGLSLSPQNPDGRIYYSYLMFYQRMTKEAIRLLAEGLEAGLEHKDYVVYFVRRCLETTEDRTLIASAAEMIPEIDARIAAIDGDAKAELAARERQLEFYRTVPAVEPERARDVRARFERRRAETEEKIAEIAARGNAGTEPAALSDAEKTERAERRARLESNRLILAVGAVQALILRGNFAEAARLTTAYGIDGTMTGQVLRAQVLWESGDRDEALRTLDRVVAGSRGNMQVALLRAHYQELAGNVARARSDLLNAAIATENPEALARLIFLFDAKTEAEARERLVADYLRRYADKPDALFLLAQTAANKNDFALVERLYKIASERIFENITRFEMVYIEMLVAADRPKEALDMLKKLNEENTDWVERNAPLINCLRTLAYYKSGNEQLGRLGLENMVKSRGAAVQQLVLVGRRLTEMGLLDEGKSAYEAAYLTENYNHKALVALVDYALEKKDVETLFRYLPELLDARRPPRRTLERIRRFLGSDRMLFVAERDDYLRRVSELLESQGATSASDADAPEAPSIF